MIGQNREQGTVAVTLKGSNLFMERTGLHPWTNAVVTMEDGGRFSACVINTSKEDIILRQGEVYGTIHLACHINERDRYPWRTFLHEEMPTPELKIDRRQRRQRRPLRWLEGPTTDANRDVRLKYLLDTLFTDDDLHHPDHEIMVSLLLLQYWELFDWEWDWSKPAERPGRKLVQHRYANESAQDLERRLRWNLAAQEELEQDTTPWKYKLLIVEERLIGTPTLYSDFRKITRPADTRSYTTTDLTPMLRGEGVSPPQFFSDLGFLYQPGAYTRTLPNVPTGTRPCTRMAAGTRLAHSTVYRRLTQVALAGLPHHLLFPFLDDPLIFTPTAQAHLYALKKCLSTMKRAGFRTQPGRCLLLSRQALAWDHRVTPDGLILDPRTQKEGLLGSPLPRSHAELEQWLGRMKNHQHFIEGFHCVTYALQETLMEDRIFPTVFLLTDQIKEAIGATRSLVATAPLLHRVYRQIMTPMTVSIHRHQAKRAVTLTLSQPQSDDTTHELVRYGSIQLDKERAGYSAPTGHLYALASTLNDWIPLLRGRRIKLSLRPDRLDLPREERREPTAKQVEEWISFITPFLHHSEFNTFQLRHTTSTDTNTSTSDCLA